MSNQQKLARLADLLRRTPERVVPFIGAGCSIPFGAPTWGGLLRSLIAAGLDDGRISSATAAEIDDLLTRGQYIEAGQRVEDALGGPGAPALALALESLLEGASNTEVDDSIIHRVQLLRPALTVTTNYDTVFEDLWYRSRGLPRLRTATRLDPHVLNSRPAKAWLVKLHGDIEHPSTVVLSHRSYMELLREQGYRANLQTLVSSRILWFLGFGMHDQDLDLVFDWSVSERQGFGTHFALLPRESAVSRTKLDRWGVHPIWYSNEDGSHQGAVQVVREILALVHPGYEAVSTRRESKKLGLVAWTSPDAAEALIVDSYGNVVALPKSKISLDLNTQTGFHHALDYLRQRLSASDVWTAKDGDRWTVHLAFSGANYEVGNGESKEAAVRDAILMIPPELPDSPATFAYLRGRSGTLARVHHPNVVGTYCYLMPSHSPNVVFPLGRLTVEQCEGVLEHFQDKRQEVLDSVAQPSRLPVVDDG